MASSGPVLRFPSIVRVSTGYDRVIVYKFHNYNHGEILSEIMRLT